MVKIQRVATIHVYIAYALDSFMHTRNPVVEITAFMTFARVLRLIVVVSACELSCLTLIVRPTYEDLAL